MAITPNKGEEADFARDVFFFRQTFAARVFSAGDRRAKRFCFASRFCRFIVNERTFSESYRQ